MESNAWIALAGILFVAFYRIILNALMRENAKSNSKKLPSPTRIPILGHLHLLDGNPFVQMTKLAETYGEIYALQLGTVNTVVVNSFRLFKQILVEKGGHFGDRINFLRYNVLFGNDKENSLAFCDWSEVQRTRRSLARRFCHTNIFADKSDEAIHRAADWMSKTIRQSIGTEEFGSQLKMILNKTCAMSFFGFFCSTYFDECFNQEFELTVELFDEIFYEINQSHATDVLPILAPFFRKHLNNLAGKGTRIRQFVVEQIINPHLEKLDKDNPEDFVDILLTHLQDGDAESRLSLDQILYELEDFIGGHSAISNLLARALVEIGSAPGLSDRIFEKCVCNSNDAYMQAVVYETLRKTSSPIVPHVASVDTEIDGYEIKKGTMVIFNNFDINTNAKYWTNPKQFIPERFLTETGHFKKPSHFLPFSTGKRACMGYKLVEKATEVFIKTIVRDYSIESFGQGTSGTMPISCVALHPKFDLNITFKPRNSS